MKTLLLPMLLLCLHGTFAQCKVKEQSIDEFTGKKYTILKEGYVGNLVAIVSKSDSSYFVMLIGRDLGCSVTGKSKAMLKMEDGSILEFIHVGKTSCSGYTGLLLRVNNEIDALLTNRVTTVRLVGSTSQQTEQIKKGQDFIARGLTCLQAY